MKKIFTLLLLAMASCNLFAKPVSPKTAKTVGGSFLRYKSKSPQLNSISESNLALVYQPTIKPDNNQPSVTGFYVFNNTAGKGFVIVSGDDNAVPVLAYSDEENFDPAHIPVTVVKWLEYYKTQMRIAASLNTDATDEIKSSWKNLSTGVKPASPTQQAVVVAPLMQTKWDQSPYYNALCPYDNQQSERTVTGCVATAMAQIMKKWAYPANGAGFHSYNTQSYGTLSSNFGSTSYQWAAMPNVVNSTNNAVATLMYQLGVSVDMNYGVANTGGSGAYVINAQSPVTNCAEYALKTYFGYDPTLKGVEKNSYIDAQWLTLLKNELNAGRPILYAGFGGGGGHCFVADGYDDNNMFHFNWGWSGYYDGYFAINALNPGGVGTGGGTGGFNSGHQAVIGIKPLNNNGGGGGGTTTTHDLRLYDNLNVTNSSSTASTFIYYGEAFSVTTKIANYAAAGYSGDFCAALFDASNNFVDYIDSVKGISLATLTYNTYTFSCDGLFSVLPGDYKIGLFYRPTGGNWVIVADNASYTNLKALPVKNPNNIELYSNMAVTPSVLTKGQTASVNLNIANTGETIFKGQYLVGLYNLDGSYVQTIGTYNETTGLDAGYMYTSPFLTFTTAAITAEPGTYLLAVQHKPTGASNWQLTGASYYQNPIKVTVKAAAIQPDVYEVNNTVAQAAALTASFSGNTASIKTTGSNCHIGSDYDYYKIELPAGYNYSISARLQDSYSAADGKTYTLDALFSDSTNMAGSSWSDAFDDVRAGNIVLNGGGTVYFKVAPYFTGETGTYLLDIGITRTQASASTYTFTGNGNWSNAANWVGGQKPPTPLPSGKEIIISPSGECILDTPQTISAGGKLTIKQNARFTIKGSLTQQ